MKRINNQPVSQLSNEISSKDIQAMFLERAKNAILATAVELMEQDMARLCGEKFSRKSEKDFCHRGGSEQTSLMVDGAKVSVRKPRARKDGKEVELTSLTKMRDKDLLDEQMQSRIMRGVSTRNYAEVINGFSEKTGISKSSVSRSFKKASKKDLDAINNADLSFYKFVSIMIDGTGFGDRTLIVALGVTDDNQKIPLGLIEGNTENAEVVKDLLTSITARHFTFAAERLLAVLDGGKALRAAVIALWGSKVIIQRCWLHKLRNIQGYIPDVNYPQFYSRMKKIMALNDYNAAKAEVESLANWLSTISCDAESSLREARDEILTVHLLAMTGEFRRSLSSTNLIESLIGVVKNKMRNVKNWKYHPKTKEEIPRDKVLRWVASSIQAHRNKMRRVRGGKEQMKILINKLNQLDLQKVSA